MKIYMARQPIYNSDKTVFGYELLYRNSNKNCYSSKDPNRATKELTYNLLSEFDFEALTNEKYGFINFTGDLLMENLPLLFENQKVVIEILEDVEMSDELVEKVAFLKSKNYTFALDDFIDDGTYDRLIPYVDIIKVVYTSIDKDLRKSIAEKYKNSKNLVAERIETKEDFESALNDGYNLIQGYYFSKPIMVSKECISMASTTYLRLIKEISKLDLDIDNIAEIIKLDAGLTYKLFALMNTPAYYRGGKISSVKQALIRLGADQMKKWIMLLFLRDISGNNDDEFAKLSLSRAIFMENIVEKLNRKELSQDMYILGLLSMIDNILDDDLMDIFKALNLSEDIKNSLINKEGLIFEVLDCIKEYEQSNWDKVDKFAKKYNLSIEIISSIYLEALKKSDDIFEIDYKK